MSLLEVRGLTVHYQGEAAVQPLDFTLAAGETLALVGESGCGKSTTALALMGLLPDTARVAGSVCFEGTDLLTLRPRQLRRLQGDRLAMVFQEPLSSLNPVLTLGEQLVETLRQHTDLSRRQALTRAEELLAQVRLPRPAAHLREYPQQLSGGQRQRVLIADEPTTALDVTVQAQILELLDSLRRELDMGLLLITHDLGVVAQQADRVIVMHDGEVLETGRTTQVFAQPRHPYTRGLVAASLGRDHQRHYRQERLVEIRVERPSAQAPRYGLSSERYAPGRQPRPPQGTPLLRAEGLRLSYPGQPQPVLDDLSLTVGVRETVGLVGESGCGKSTLSRALLRLQTLDAGRIDFAGSEITALAERPLRAWRRHAQLIFQDAQAALNPRHDVTTLLDRVQRLHGQEDAAERQRARLAILDAVGLPRTSLGRLPHQFSGGQRQRLGIARALILKPRLLICDEPVSALDVSVRAQILNLLVELREAFDLSYLFISHDLSVVRYLADRVLVMQQGRIVEEATPAQLWQQPCHPYTRTLLAAVPGVATAPTAPAGLRFAVGW